MAPKRPLHVVILAGGEGKRMGSDQPKVLLDLLGRPIVGHVIDAARALGPRSLIVVGGRGLPDIKRAMAAEDDLTFVRQPKPLGTANAVKHALKALPKRGAHEVLILNGDGPLVTSASLRKTLQTHRRRKAQVTVISAIVPEPTGLGRIIRDGRGRFLEVVEEKDATDDQREIPEINAGQYVVGLPDLHRLLPRIGRGNVQGEFYLTDLIGLADRVAAVPLDDAEEARGLNDPKELLEVRDLMRRRVLERHAAAGVQIVAPDLTYVEAGVYIAPGSVVLPFTVLRRGVSIAPRCSVGPFAHLRPGTALHEDVHVGDFVEIKASTLGQGSKALHLAYLGDTDLGKGVNVGAGTITANFDGRRKHRTIVEDGVSLGSGTILVAPVTVGKGSRTGAGAVVLSGQDVPSGETVVGVPARKKRRR
ncbi:MAG: UDP-N-acetylglucosamine pyrophosphorylase [Planctomycetes bacterium]|nr:UDP-N-acetylglucosamine pyrophosphorylase [Planctomycetota bacterium]